MADGLNPIGRTIARIKDRIRERKGGHGYNVANPRNILGAPKRKFYTNKSKGKNLVPLTRGDFQTQDLRRVGYEMEQTAKEVARLMSRKADDKKISESKLARLIVKGNMLANKHNNLVDEYGGTLSSHVTFYNKDGSGIANEYYDMLSSGQRLSGDRTGYSKEEAQNLLRPRTGVASKGIPNIIDESKLPKPQLIKKAR